MKAYYDRYAYRNATVEGLLQTVEDQFGTEIRQRMDDNLNKPNYELKPEFRLTEAEKANFNRTTMTQLYDGILGQHPDLPQESMVRIMSKTLHGEPLAIVLSDAVSPEAAAQQEIVKDSLLNMLDMSGLKATVLTERQAVKKNMETTLAKSNVIAIGNSSKNAFVQAMKPQLVEKSAQSGFPWKEVMGKRGLYGAYGTVHPYNKNRLVVHYFWTDDHVNDKVAEAFCQWPASARCSRRRISNSIKYSSRTARSIKRNLLKIRFPKYSNNIEYRHPYRGEVSPAVFYYKSDMESEVFV